VEAQRSYSRNRLAALHSQAMAARPQPHAVAGDEALHASVAQDDFSSVVDADHHFH